MSRNLDNLSNFLFDLLLKSMYKEIEKEALIRFTIAFVISKRKPIYFILLQVKGNFVEV